MRVVYQIVGFTPISVDSSRLYNTSVFEFKKNRVKSFRKGRMLKEYTNKYKHIRRHIKNGTIKQVLPHREICQEYT
ncbi:hypothetical protein HanXRQr2_Chr15g0697691 [Helianthus annuus]|uniref:Uncharacterized protein n=1 Tax=Helianthus annuus TaxID=4232 RepID=A0A9K3E2M6_HELAN|nr:hypothetical protein HanXRQr2_Chr15g0697691 [Helianthus annuus]